MRKSLITVFALASLAVVLGLTFFLGSVISREVALRMNELKAKSIAQIESALGRTVSYASISPSFLNYLEVRDLVIHDAADPQVPLLTIHRVRIYYSLVQLLFRHDPVGALREIRILNTRFSLDLQKDKASHRACPEAHGKRPRGKRASCPDPPARTWEFPCGTARPLFPFPTCSSASIPDLTPSPWRSAECTPTSRPGTAKWPDPSKLNFTSFAV